MKTYRRTEINEKEYEIEITKGYAYIKEIDADTGYSLSLTEEEENEVIQKLGRKFSTRKGWQRAVSLTARK